MIFMFRGGRSVLICSEKEGALTKPFGQAVRKVYSKVRDVPTHGGTLRYYPDGSPYDGKGRTVQRCQPVRCWFSRGRDSGFARNGG